MIKVLEFLKFEFNEIKRIDLQNKIETELKL